MAHQLVFHFALEKMSSKIGVGFGGQASAVAIVVLSSSSVCQKLVNFY